MRALPTPSSLKWLINRRARLAGELEKSSKIEAERLSNANKAIAKAHAAYLELLEDNEFAIASHRKYADITSHAITATDLLLREHEIPIDPEDLPVIREHSTPAISNYGNVTGLIYECLGRANGQARSTTEVAIYVATSITPKFPLL